MALHDPYRNFKFEVEVNGFVHAGFSKVTGLEHNVEVIDYREGGENETPRRVPGQSSFGAVTFERGASDNHDFVTWIEQIFDLDNQKGKQGANSGWRKTLVVYLKDKSGTRVKKWRILQAWPSQKAIGDLDAGTSEVLIESLVVQNEGIKETKL